MNTLGYIQIDVTTIEVFRMKPLYAIILAAGKGTRMKSKKHKVLHAICGKTMIDLVLDELSKIQPQQTFLVTGHESVAVQEHVGDRVVYVQQVEQLGTGHAVMQTASHLEDKPGMTLVLNGDHPLYTSETIVKLLEKHETSGAAATILSAKVHNPAGYGRIVRSKNGEVNYIVEHKDASSEEREINEINTGTYLFDNQKLFRALQFVNNENAQGEYYLPDVISILKSQGEAVQVEVISDADEAQGINDRVQLAEAEAYLRKRILHRHQIQGVRIVDPLNTYIDASVEIGPDTVIEPGVFLRGDTSIGEGCHIGPNVDMTDTTVEELVHIRYTVIQGSEVRQGAKVGPYAYIRPNTVIENEGKIGCFIDLKNARIGKQSVISHLAYVGDADVGENVNIGCGAITVNYNGKTKHKTVIEDNTFVGCNSNLVAPVTIKKGAYIATGSTITEDVPSDSLAIARERQTTKVNYVPKLMSRLSKE